MANIQLVQALATVPCLAHTVIVSSEIVSSEPPLLISQGSPRPGTRPLLETFSNEIFESYLILTVGSESVAVKMRLPSLVDNGPDEGANTEHPHVAGTVFGSSGQRAPGVV